MPSRTKSIKGLLRRVTSLTGRASGSRSTTNNSTENTTPAEVLPPSPYQNAPATPSGSGETTAIVPRIYAQLSAGGELTQYPGTATTRSFTFLLKFLSNAYAAQLQVLINACKVALLYAHMTTLPKQRGQNNSFNAVHEHLEKDAESFEFENEVEVQLVPLMADAATQLPTVLEHRWMDPHDMAFMQALQSTTSRHMAIVCRWRAGRVTLNPRLLQAATVQRDAPNPSYFTRVQVLHPCGHLEEVDMCDECGRQHRTR